MSEICKNGTKAYIQQLEQQRDEALRRIEVACKICKQSIEFADVNGSIYEIHWDNGDSSVGINAGWVCDEEFSTPEMVEEATGELQAKVALLHGALEQAKPYLAMAAEYRKLISMGVEWDDCAAAKVLDSINKALSTTPPETAERINALIEFVEDQAKRGTFLPDRKLAQIALAKFRGIS